jgi:hypothetical protein
MKHLTMAEKSLLLGDEAADLLLEYAALLGQTDSADTVVLNAYGDDGDPVEVTFLLNGGTSVLAESSESTILEPDNDAGVRYMRERMTLIQSPPPAQPMDAQPTPNDWEL